MKFENGIYDISNADYHGSEGISRSALFYLKKSPYHYWYKYLSGYADKVEPTTDMNIGSAVHTLTLEQHKFKDEFFITSQQTRTKKGTPPHEKMIFEANNRIILTPKEFHLAIDISESIMKSDAFPLLAGCHVERSIYFTHKSTGVQCKVRPDAMLNGLVCDLKTSVDASKRAFTLSAVTYGYYLQAAMIHEALSSLNQPMEQFVFIVVEKKPPYAVAIYTLSDEALEYGIKQLNELLSKFTQCIDENKWPGFAIQELGLPGWLKFDNELEGE